MQVAGVSASRHQAGIGAVERRFEPRNGRMRLFFCHGELAIGTRVGEYDWYVK